MSMHGAVRNFNVCISYNMGKKDLPDIYSRPV